MSESKAVLWDPEEESPRGSFLKRFFTDPYSYFFLSLVLSLFITIMKRENNWTVMRNAFEEYDSVKEPLVFEFNNFFKNVEIFSDLLILISLIVFVIFFTLRVRKSKKIELPDKIQIGAIILISILILTSMGSDDQKNDIASFVAKSTFLVNPDFDSGTNELTGWTDDGRVVINIKESEEGSNSIFEVVMPEEMQVKLDLSREIKEYNESIKD